MHKLLTNKEDIKQWLGKYAVTDYTLVEDAVYGYVVDVSGNVDLHDNELSAILVKFNHVSGNFLCNHNLLTTLLGCPQSVGAFFYCNHNKLKNLRHSPQTVVRNFYCNHNQITNLIGCPKKINGDFYCYHNRIKSLKNGPQTISGDFYCQRNNLANLNHFPEMNGTIHIDQNPALGAYQDFTDYTQVKEILDIIAEKKSLSKHKDIVSVVEQKHIYKI